MALVVLFWLFVIAVLIVAAVFVMLGPVAGIIVAGKSYLAKRLPLKLIDQNILTVAFDLKTLKPALLKIDLSGPA